MMIYCTRNNRGMPLTYIELHGGSVCELPKRARSKANYEKLGYGTVRMIDDIIVPMIYCIYFQH